MPSRRFLLAAAAATVLAPPALGQLLGSWDPLSTVENALPIGSPDESKIIQARHQVREMSNDALWQLYDIYPDLRPAIERAPGYGVFSTRGLKLFFTGGSTGRGMVVNNRTGRQTFMTMLQVQAGLGFGATKTRLILAFTDEQALRNFIDVGLELGTQLNVGAAVGGAGAALTSAIPISPGVYAWQLTETGLSATLTVAGTKYFRDDRMN